MSTSSLLGKTVLVTGASRGIGRAMAVKFCEAGARVGAFARSREPLEELAGELNDGGPARCLAVPGDVRSEEDVESAAAVVAREFGPVDILVNNAGTARFRPLSEATAGDFLDCFAVNVLGAFRFTRLVLPGMLANGWGRVINVASVSALKPYAGQGAYCASKHALLGYSKVLALELQGTGVRVHVIHPGRVDTEMVREREDDPRRREWMQPDEIAEVAVWLAQMDGVATIDEVVVRREGAQPWGY